MRPGQVIFLNGAPSVGKSSTARALQVALASPYYYLGLDEYRRGYRDHVWLADNGTLFQRMVGPFLRNLATLARAGHDVIAESMLTDDNEDLYLEGFRDLPVIFVVLRCRLEVAQARESARGDRRKGRMDLDQPLWHSLHKHGCYDLEVDTSTLSPEEVAHQILGVVDDPPTPTAFDRLRLRREAG